MEGAPKFGKKREKNRRDVFASPVKLSIKDFLPLSCRVDKEMYQRVSYTYRVVVWFVKLTAYSTFSLPSRLLR